MVCPNCKHVYPISNGIPNMVRLPCSCRLPLLTLEQLLAEHEIA